MNDELTAVVAESCLAHLPEDTIAALFVGAERLEVPAGSRICVQEGPAVIRIIVSGLLRIARSAPDGRAMTQRYVRRGDVSGIPAFFVGRASAECQAILDSVYYQVQGEAWRDRARRDAQLSYALLQEVSRILDVTFVHLAEEALGSMRQRVARQLLDIAADRHVSHDLVAPVTQQQLADDIGSVREVVARALRDLRERGIVATGTRGIVILDAQALREELDPVA